MAYIISKKSKKGGVERKLYYIVRAYRDKLSGKPAHRILFSLGMSEDLNAALKWRRAQCGVIIEKLNKLDEDYQLADKGMFPPLIHYPRNEQVRIILVERSKLQEELEEIKKKMVEVEQLMSEFPECCSARSPS